MGLWWLPSLWFVLVLPPLPGSNSQALAYAVIRRAIAAEGGEEQLARQVATHSRCKGKVLFLGNTSFSGETWTEKGPKVRQLLEIDAQGMRRVVLVLNGRDGWVSYDGRVETMAPDMLALVHIESYVDHVTNLVPLLHEKQFRLTWMGEASRDGHLTAEVKVSAHGKPDVLLYFDRDTGLLSKREYRSAERGSDKLVTFVSRYSDYRMLRPAECEEQILHDAGIAADGPALVRYLRARCLSNAALAQLHSLIGELGSRSFRTREKAQAALTALGPPAIPFLQEACKSTDLEVARRAQASLRRIYTKGVPDPAVTVAVIRLLGFRAPAGSAAALLAFLPFAPDAATAGEARWVLRQLARSNAEQAAIIRRALDDADASRRTAASEALDQARATGGSHRVFLGEIKIPHHIETVRDNEPSMSYDTIGIEYFDHFDKHLFARP